MTAWNFWDGREDTTLHCWVWYEVSQVQTIKLFILLSPFFALDLYFYNYEPKSLPSSRLLAPDNQHGAAVIWQLWRLSASSLERDTLGCHDVHFERNQSADHIWSTSWIGSSLQNDITAGAADIRVWRHGPHEWTEEEVWGGTSHFVA